MIERPNNIRGVLTFLMPSYRYRDPGSRDSYCCPGAAGTRGPVSRSNCQTTPLASNGYSCPLVATATRTGIPVRATLLVAFILAGCSSSRRAAAPPPPPPDSRVEVSVIPPQELKGNRPFFQWQTSFGQSNNPTPDDATLGPSANPINSDGL